MFLRSLILHFEVHIPWIIISFYAINVTNTLETRFKIADHKSKTDLVPSNIKEPQNWC